MDATTGTSIVKDLVKNNNVLSEAGKLFGMLFPYVGLEKKALEAYLDDIKKSDMSPEVKAFTILKTKETFKKIKNQKAIADIAIENADEQTDFSENSGVSEDWLDRFMDSAGFVSLEELQLVWGKILANEFKKPGTTPPNMIRILSEITPEMAKAFRCICSMSVIVLPLKEDGSINTSQYFRRNIVPYSENERELNELGLSFNMLNELETLGVLKFDSIGYIVPEIHNEKILICVDEQLALVEEHRDNSVPSGNVMLTSVGIALQQITDKIDIEDYFDMVKNTMSKAGVKFAEKHDFKAKLNNGQIIIERMQHE